MQQESPQPKEEQMIPNMPTVGVRFDPARMNAATRAEDAWKAFWAAVDPAALVGCVLFDGDGEGAFYVAIQSVDGGQLAAIEGAVTASPECRALAADPMIARGDDVTRQTLSGVGNVDAEGSLLGEGVAVRAALVAVRPEVLNAAAAKPMPPAGVKPVPEMPRRFASRSTTIGSHAARAALSGGVLARPQSPAPGGTRVTSTRKKTSSVGRTILTVIVVIVVLACIAIMIFGPEPARAPARGSKRPAPAAVEEAAPAEDAGRPASGSPAGAPEAEAGEGAGDETDVEADEGADAARPSSPRRPGNAVDPTGPKSEEGAPE